MKPIILKTGLVAAAIVTSLLIGELWAISAPSNEIKPPQRPTELTLPSELVVSDKTLGRHFRPNAAVFFAPEHGDFAVHYQINEYGLRDAGTIFPGDRPPHVIVLGDAIAEGWGVMTEATFIRETQRQLRLQADISQHTRIFNAGMTGFGAAQSYLLAARLLENLGADLVVLVYTSLMPVADHRFLQHANLDDSGLAISAGVERPDDSVQHAESSRWRHRSHLLDLAYSFYDARNARRAFTPGDPMSDPFAAAREPAGAALLHGPSLRHVAALAELVHANGAQFMLLHVPLPHQVAADEFKAGREPYQLDARRYPAYDEAIVKTFCQEHGINCLMSTQTLRELADSRASAVYFEHAYTLTEVGHRAVGNLLRGPLHDILATIPTTRY